MKKTNTYSAISYMAEPSSRSKSLKAIKVLLLFAAMTITNGCSTKMEYTTVKINDEIRHYYPIMAGRKLVLSYEIENTGKAPLVISEIQTTCGCITSTEERLIVPEGQKSILNFEYDSSKNIGYVENEILLYGNFDSTSVYRLYFDINVVPHADYTKDYEELYNESVDKKIISSKKEEDRKNRKNYYTDPTP